MKMYAIQIISAMVAVFAVHSCSEPEQPAVEKPTEKIEDITKVMDNRFPNERSELAVLMRNMYDDLKAEKQLLTNGETSDISWLGKYGNLVSATPTDEKHTGPEFEAFGKSFLVQLQAYEEASKKNQIKLYNNVITSCLGCHQRHCPGPITAIKKLPL